MYGYLCWVVRGRGAGRGPALRSRSSAAAAPRSCQIVCFNGFSAIVAVVAIFMLCTHAFGAYVLCPLLSVGCGEGINLAGFVMLILSFY